MRKKLVIGNWKMHGSLVENEQLLNAIIPSLNELHNGQFALCIPYPYLSSVQNILEHTRILWGAQDVSQYEKGAYTGEVSASMLKDFRCSFAIVGHSERRTLFGENNHIIAEKYIRAQRTGIMPVLCVGETLEHREGGITERIIKEQLAAVINMAGVESLAESIIAYEPVWAIGTGRTASPKQAQDVHFFIRSTIAEIDINIAREITILYGGSVKANNAAELFTMSDIDGGLIGGASLIADEFIGICRALRN